MVLGKGSLTQVEEENREIYRVCPTCGNEFYYTYSRHAVHQAVVRGTRRCIRCGYIEIVDDIRVWQQ